MNWHHLFKNHILDRGHTYFFDGAVKELQESNGIITATVCGTEVYEVEITIKNATIKDMYCSCPHADSGAHCKHMAAVLYKWGENDDDEIFDDVEDIDYTDMLSTEVESTVSQADEVTIRKFLTVILQENDKLYSRFKMQVAPEVTPKDMQRYKQQVNRTIQEYTGWSQLIPYNEAYDFICEMEKYLSEDVQMMLEGRCYLEAFELTNFIYVKVGELEMDDSDGGTCMLANHCYDIWNKILDEVDSVIEETMFNWFSSRLDGSNLDYYMEEFIEHIIMERFTEQKYIDAKLEFTNRKVHQAKSNPDSWRSDYYIAKWALRHIHLMEVNHDTWENIQNYCRENWKYSDIRKYYVTKSMEQKNYDQAIVVLKESIKLDVAMPGLVNYYSNTLKDAYRLNGNMEEYKNQLWHLVTKVNAGKLQQFRELKNLYSEEEWLQVREKIFESLSPHAPIDQLYNEEKLYDRLLTYVLSLSGLYKMQQYEEILVKDYPEQILQKYADEVNDMAKHTASRSIYRDWVDILRSMLKIKGGKEKVEEIVQIWKCKYRNRRAMLDELNRL